MCQSSRGIPSSRDHQPAHRFHGPLLACTHGVELAITKAEKVCPNYCLWGGIRVRLQPHLKLGGLV